MASIEENRILWNEDYNWISHGNEWSQSWGGVYMQWFGMIYPRIKNFIPAGTILEIAPGHGRWTQFLLDNCKEMKIVDLSDSCISVCKKKFKSVNHIEYFVNDGKTLEMIKNESVDFVFSFDSLVHAEDDVIDSYLGEVRRTLSRNGVGFIHHSNMLEYSRYFKIIDMIPRGRGFLSRLGLIESKEHLRAHSMSAKKFESFCYKNDLKCIGQEIVNWSSKRLIDCISLFCRNDSVWSRPNVIIRNEHYMQEMNYLNKLSKIYGANSFKK